MSSSGPIELRVHVAYDGEAGRWFVAESDIPGLRLEAADAGTLLHRIEEAAPELIELNGEEVTRRFGLEKGDAVGRLARRCQDSI